MRLQRQPVNPSSATRSVCGIAQIQPPQPSLSRLPGWGAPKDPVPAVGLTGPCRLRQRANHRLATATICSSTPCVYRVCSGQPLPRSGVDSNVDPLRCGLLPAQITLCEPLLVSSTCKDTRSLATSQSPHRAQSAPTTLRYLLGADAVAICDSVSQVRPIFEDDPGVVARRGSCGLALVGPRPFRREPGHGWRG